MNVAAILAAKGTTVISITSRRTLADAVALLADKRIGAVIVRDDEGPVHGILSERDIVRALALVGAEALAEPVARYMTTAVATTERDEPMSSLMERMTNGRFRHMPVVEHGRVIGIVSIGDVVKYRVAEAEAEANAMREYIAAG